MNRIKYAKVVNPELHLKTHFKAGTSILMNDSK